MRHVVVGNGAAAARRQQPQGDGAVRSSQWKPLAIHQQLPEKPSQRRLPARPGFAILGRLLAANDLGLQNTSE